MKARLACLVILVTAAAEEKMTLCGRQLANARVMLCFGPQYVDKRSGVESLLAAIASDTAEPWLEPERWDRRDALAARWSRGKRFDGGLVSECCLKPCYLEEIKAYC